MEDLIHLIDINNLPLSSNQKRLWILSQQDKLNPSYNILLSYHIQGEINIDIFQKSIQLLFDRQHTMFSVFKQKDGVPYIKIIPGKVVVDLINFSDLKVLSRREQILSFAGEVSRKCFNIETGPLFRLYLLREDEKDYFFCAIVHHLIFDGYSRRLFVNELSNIYRNLVIGYSIAFEPLRFHSYDFAEFEMKALSKLDEKMLIDFWKEYFKDCPCEFKFPFDYPRNTHPSGLGCREPFRIPKKHSKNLRDISRETDTSIFKIILSVLGLLLKKYTGENDICIGVPVSNRRSSSSFKVFGLFVNTMPVRLILNDRYNYKDYIKYTTETTNMAIAHSALPFEKIVENVNPERISGLNPFFQISFSWITNFTIPMNLGTVKGTKITVNKGVAPFDLTFYMWENGDIIEGEIEYNIDLLKRETIIRLKESFLTLISNIVEKPDLSIDSLPILTEKEEKIIQSFNKTQTDYPKDKTIIQLFEEQVLLYPDKTAVVFKGEALTYKELNLKTNRLAYSLREKGVGRNTPVGIMAEKSLDVIVGILGILKTGGVYVPIDPDYPQQRIDFIIGDSGCKFLLTQEKYMNLSVENVIKLNLNSPDSFHKNQINIENVNTSSDLAYIMYTSGTTGNPKGSMINQYSIVRLVRNTNYIDITVEDRILLTSAIVFDVATFEIWGALLNGGSLYIAEKETILNPKALGAELVKNNITILWLTSALFTHIAESRVDIFGKLKYLLVGGDVLSAPHINKVRKANPELKVINGYGPTENTTFSTTYLIEKDFDYNIPIGKPISNSTTYIFDKNMNYQPIGVIGELYVGGDGVSKGYINRDDLNKKSFMDHPYIPGERIYKTGDYARWLPDGNIEFHGRVDNQLKIRGFRVELEEIESVISKIDGVIETVIKPVKVNEGDYKLIAYLNVPVTFKMDSKDISKQIKSKLPPYMVPSAYKFMQGFLRTINGKIDRKALSFDLKELENKEGMDIKTMTPTEEAIYKIWSEALKTKEISVTDNFFDIGGNSLMAISIMSKIESAFNIDLGLRLFFDSPLIKNIGEMIDIKIESFDTKKTVKKKLNTDPKIIKGEI